MEEQCLPDLCRQAEDLWLGDSDLQSNCLHNFAGFLEGTAFISHGLHGFSPKEKSFFTCVRTCEDHMTSMLFMFAPTVFSGVYDQVNNHRTAALPKIPMNSVCCIKKGKGQITTWITWAPLK